MNKFIVVATASLLMISPVTFAQEGTWRDATELARQHAKDGSYCASDKLAKGVVYIDVHPAFEYRYIELAKTKGIATKAWFKDNESLIDREIKALGFDIEQNVFDRKEQIEKFSGLINAHIEKLRNAKEFCSYTESKNYLFTTSLNRYNIDDKYIFIGIEPAFKANYNRPYFSPKRQANDTLMMWSVVIPTSMNEGRKWEALIDGGRFKAVDTPVTFTITCSKTGRCEFDATHFEYPYMGDDGQQHAYIYDHGTFKSN